MKSPIYYDNLLILICYGYLDVINTYTLFRISLQ